MSFYFIIILFLKFCQVLEFGARGYKMIALGKAKYFSDFTSVVHMNSFTTFGLDYFENMHKN